VTDHDRPVPEPEPNLRLPPPPVGSRVPPEFPAPPGRPPYSPAQWDRSGRQLAAVALIAGLLGALLGSGIAMVTLRPSARQASQPSLARQVVAPAVPPPSDGQTDRVAVIAAAVLPTVVQIDVSGKDAEVHGLSGNGSGVIYRSDGFIVTNHHVVAKAAAIDVRFDDGTTKPARVVGTDPINDLAVIKVEATNLPAIQIGDSSKVRIGELAVAIGSPFGLPGSVTAGIVSGLNRPLDITYPEGQDVRLVNVIQTDAPINPGNSGGALVGIDGRLIGINSAIFTHGQPANSGIGFAIAAETVVRVAEELIANGFVRHSYLGVRLETLSPQDASRLGVSSGARIDSVEPGAPADQAGLRSDDVITKVDGTVIRSMDDLISLLRKRDVGQRVSITYVRGGVEHTLAVVLAELPSKK
jgi:S1-C subfamily serine protease